MHAAIDLDVDGDLSGRRLQQCKAGAVVESERQLRRDRRGERVRRGVSEIQNGLADAGLAQLETFGNRRHRQPGRTTLDRGSRRGHGAVPVAIGLDDGHHRRLRTDELFDEGGVVSDGRWIDVGPFRRALLRQQALASGRRRWFAAQAAEARARRPTRAARFVRCERLRRVEVTSKRHSAEMGRRNIKQIPGREPVLSAPSRAESAAAGRRRARPPAPMTPRGRCRQGCECARR